jgi:sec-independent protein translocase protein TatB
MSFSDTAFLFFLALILFGPKKLPELARQAGRILGELRRASNEFRSQIENEIHQMEVEKNTKQTEAYKTQAALPSSATPQETEASLAVSPVGETVPRVPDCEATLAAPSVATSAPPTSDVAPIETSTHSEIPGEAPASQESHV